MRGSGACRGAEVTDAKAKNGRWNIAIDRKVYGIEKIPHGQYDIRKIYKRYEAAMYLVRGSERACLIDTANGLTGLPA